MPAKEELSEYLKNIHDLIYNMAQDHRIRSDDLDNFNH